MRMVNWISDFRDLIAKIEHFAGIQGTNEEEECAYKQCQEAIEGFQERKSQKLLFKIIARRQLM
jgi:hypothetical protein